MREFYVSPIWLKRQKFDFFDFENQFNHLLQKNSEALIIGFKWPQSMMAPPSEVNQALQPLCFVYLVPLLPKKIYIFCVLQKINCFDVV